MSQIISSDFMGSFKIGDNINHNLKILSLLYSYFAEGGEKRKLLCKPIIILEVSIIDAVLFDFLTNRIKGYTREGINSIDDEIVSVVRGKTIDKFEKCIACIKKHDLLGIGKDALYYDELDILRKLRNRVHIQNEKNDFEPDEVVAFSEERKVMSEKVLERFLKQMAELHQRAPNHVKGHVLRFELPWDAHTTG